MNMETETRIIKRLYKIESNPLFESLVLQKVKGYRKKCFDIISKVIQNGWITIQNKNLLYT